MCNFAVCQVCLLVLLCGELISQCRARDYAIVPFGGMHLQCMALLHRYNTFYEDHMKLGS